MAGVVRRRADAPPPDAIAQQLRGAIARLHDSRVEVVRGPDSFFISLDFGAHGAPGRVTTPDGSVSLLCGEPLLAPHTATSRLDDLTLLHRELAHGDATVLRRACGTFAIAHFDAPTSTLVLATDRVGFRPLYVWADRDYVVFASAQRILEAVAQMPKTIDVQGLTEEAAFGFPLGDRTAYTACKLLRSGEVLVASPTEIRRSRYARWDEVLLSGESEAERASRVYEAFATAVQRRLRGRQLSLAFLTGGLDSRCIVSELRRQGSDVHSYCFGADGSQDIVFAEQFARAVGSVHQRVPVPPSGFAPYPGPERLPLDASRAQPIWSGDGGSVGLGHVYLTAPMIERMRRGDRAGAIRLFREHNFVHVPARILASEVPSPDEALDAAMDAELAACECEDPGRALFLFLLHNDQRRHLGKHFENLDRHQWEFALPFFDADLLATIIATPIDWCLGHRLYHRVLRCFTTVTTSVPWQAYPGHEPCPLPVPAELSYQWRGQDTNPRHLAVRREQLANARRMLRAPRFPSELLDRNNVRAAYWLTRLRVRDYQYALGTAEVYERYWRMAQPNGQ